MTGSGPQQVQEVRKCSESSFCPLVPFFKYMLILAIALMKEILKYQRQPRAGQKLPRPGLEPGSARLASGATVAKAAKPLLWDAHLLLCPPVLSLPLLHSRKLTVGSEQQ